MEKSKKMRLNDVLIVVLLKPLFGEAVQQAQRSVLIILILNHSRWI
jgi:hypothetical protein